MASNVLSTFYMCYGLYHGVLYHIRVKRILHCEIDMYMHSLETNFDGFCGPTILRINRNKMLSFHLQETSAFSVCLFVCLFGFVFFLGKEGGVSVWFFVVLCNLFFVLES